MNPTMLTVQRWTRKSWFIGRAGQMPVSSDPHAHIRYFESLKSRLSQQLDWQCPVMRVGGKDVAPLLRRKLWVHTVEVDTIWSAAPR